MVCVLCRCALVCTSALTRRYCISYIFMCVFFSAYILFQVNHDTVPSRTTFRCLQCHHTPAQTQLQMPVLLLQLKLQHNTIVITISVDAVINFIFGHYCSHLAENCTPLAAHTHTHMYMCAYMHTRTHTHHIHQLQSMVVDFIRVKYVHLHAHIPYTRVRLHAHMHAHAHTHTTFIHSSGSQTS